MAFDAELIAPASHLGAGYDGHFKPYLQPSSYISNDSGDFGNVFRSAPTGFSWYGGDAYLPLLHSADESLDGCNYFSPENTIASRDADQESNLDLQFATIDELLGIGDSVPYEDNASSKQNSISGNNVQVREMLDQYSNPSNVFVPPAADLGPLKSTAIDHAVPLSATPKLPSVTTGVNISATSATPENGNTCSQCGTTVSRASDLPRHVLVHAPPQFDCTVPTCNRKGTNGFCRADKCRDHLRQKHRITS